VCLDHVKVLSLIICCVLFNDLCGHAFDNSILFLLLSDLAFFKVKSAAQGMFTNVIFNGAPICRCGKLQSPRLCTRASITVLAFNAFFLPRLRVARSHTRTASFVDLRCKYNGNYVLLAMLGRGLRLHSCTDLSEQRGPSLPLCARRIGRPWCARLGPAEKDLAQSTPST